MRGTTNTETPGATTASGASILSRPRDLPPLFAAPQEAVDPARPRLLGKAPCTKKGRETDHDSTNGYSLRNRPCARRRFGARARAHGTRRGGRQHVVGRHRSHV